MSQASKVKVWVIISAFSLVILSLTFSFLQTPRVVINNFKKDAIQNIASVIDKKHTENNILRQSIKQKGLFQLQSFYEDNKFIYIFNFQHIVFWSSNRFQPEYNKIKGNYAEKYIELKSGKFLAIKDTVSVRGELFEIINLCPLYYVYNISNQYIQPGPNRDLFNNQEVDVNNYAIENDLAIKNKKGEYLFSIQVPTTTTKDVGLINVAILFNIVIFLTTLTGFVWSSLPIIFSKISKTKVDSLLIKHDVDFKLIIILFYLILIRGILLFLKIPHSIINARYFNQNYYHWNSLTPTPGDLLIHLFFLVLYLLVVKHLFRKSTLFALISHKSASNSYLSLIFKIFIITISHISLFYSSKNVVAIFNAQKLPLDITEIASFDLSLFLTAFHIILSVASFIGISRMAYELVNKSFIKGFLYQYLPGAIIFVCLTVASPFEALIACVLHLFLFVISILLRLPTTKHSFDYSALVFYTLAGLCSAALCSLALSKQYPRRDLEQKTKFITQQLVENNLLGENLLNEISKQISADPYLAHVFSNPIFSTRDTEEKVRRFYLGNYLNKYDIKVLVFDDKGMSLSEDDSRRFSQVWNSFPYRLYKTSYPNIYYYITQQNQILKNYVGLVSIHHHGIKIGSILIDLQTKKHIPNSILPVLLVDKRAEALQNTASYSYAVFNKGELTNSFGSYNFNKGIIKKILSDTVNYNANIPIDNSYFLVSDLGKGRKIVVQSEPFSNWVLLSNFSFIFILIEFSIFLFFISNLLLFNFDQFYNSLSFKVQFYTIIAFFIPVVLVSIGVLAAVISTYNQELQQYFKDNATNIAYSLSENLEDYYHQEENIETLNESVLKTARLYNTDINIFKRNGILLSSSSPILYQSGIISPLVNPKAFFALRTEKNRLFLQQEEIGKLKYNHVYIQVLSSNTGEDLGIISIPFFTSGRALSIRITNTLKILVNIATFTFLILIFFSYAASNFITYPLKLITQRIKKTNLESDNRPLDWKSKDELGLLIQEYNVMIQKLEQNKKTLALHQKESAWREVAQQVAHEIKNPLTPIKLSLQHMRRLIMKGVQDPQKMDNTIEGLINQVETLDGIASSFSIYAKMPALILAPTQLNDVIHKAIEVYAFEKKQNIHLNLTSSPLQVQADERLLGRIIANLLLNALQAVPDEEVPEIDISLLDNEDSVIISICDNGVGISEDLKDKIFEPHFSTKFSGSGIGLYVAKKGIEQMNGEMWYENNESRGTTFFILLKKS